MTAVVSIVGYPYNGKAQVVLGREDASRASRKNARKTAVTWQIAHPDKARVRRRKWQEANPDKAREYIRIWRDLNRDKEQERKRKWLQLNRDKLSAKSSTRRTQQVQATPPWLRPDMVDGAYIAANWLTFDCTRTVIT